LENLIVVKLGGRVAEKIVFSQLTTGAGGDIEDATNWARSMVCEWGMSEGPPYGSYGKENFWVSPLIEMAGGINIASNLPGDWITVDPEWVMEQNPSIIIRAIYEMVSGPIVGYDTDNTLEAAAMREDIMSQPAFELTDAVKEEDVYLCYGEFIDSYWYIGLPYLAKWFHPELFEDLDPQALHQEFLTEFQRLDYDLGEQGVFVYPES